MIGTYRFYQHGQLLAASKNIITTEGAKAILRYLSGGGNTIGTAIGVGLGAATATVNDRRLTYELERATVTVSSPDFTTQRIIFKGTLSQGLSGKIYEAGTFTTDHPTGSSQIVNFDSSENWSSATFNSTNARNGTDAVRITAAASATSTTTISNLNLDLSVYSILDEFSLAYHHVSNVATVRVRLLSEDGTSYYQYTFTPSTNYNVKTWTKNDMTKVGNVSYSAIASVEFAITSTSGGTGTLDFDGFRVDDKDFLDPREIMISRSVLPTPITKTNLSPMDIEYALDMTLT